jgi:hypothetical protein
MGEVSELMHGGQLRLQGAVVRFSKVSMSGMVSAMRDRWCIRCRVRDYWEGLGVQD